jgi:DNA-binding NarL/FixJ family response regulator
MTTDQKKDVVLVVDDSPESLSLINDILDNSGFTVLVALEGQQALNIAANITPDIILLDAIMPNMDGFETCRRLKGSRELSHIPVIFMTGLSDTESTVKGLEAGGVDYIQKPVNGSELLARMKVHLDNARMTLSARSALDSAGQFLLATDLEGKLRWATPQAHHLFEQKGLDEEWFSSSFQGAFSKLLNARHSPGKAGNNSSDKGAVVKTDQGAVEIRYISQSGQNEYLLRMVDLERPNETETLCEAFPVTGRESDVLLWLAKGKSNSEIGLILGVSPRTVNKHLEQVYRKLNVENRTSAAVMALKALEGQA